MEDRFWQWELQGESLRAQWLRTAFAREISVAAQRNSNVSRLQEVVADSAWSEHLAFHHQRSGGRGSPAPSAMYVFTVFGDDTRHQVPIPIYSFGDCNTRAHTVWPNALLHNLIPSSPTRPTYWIDVRLLQRYKAFGLREGVGVAGV
jgi:hypothetical protein